MHAEYLASDHGGDRHHIESVGEGFPHLDGVVALACHDSHQSRHVIASHVTSRGHTVVVEAVDAVDGSTLMVAAQQKHVVGVLKHKGKQQTYGLQRVHAAVHKVAQEKVFFGSGTCVSGPAHAVHVRKQICQLPVDVAKDDEGCFNLKST